MQNLEAIRKFICCISDPLYPTPYNFQFGSNANLVDNKLAFESNFVRTSKYRWYDFLPKSLLQQFYRLANLYFLFIAILQSITIISPLSPLTAWAPLIVVLGISLIRQGYEDYQRYKSDKQLNHEYKTHILRQGKFIEVEWQQVLIGDLCMVKEKDLFPADLILLACEHPEGNAFIETASLDGQKNLKPRNAYPETQKFNTQASLSQFSGSWEGTIPNKDTEHFQSTMTFDNNTRINFKGEKQLLWRGTRLMNTKWAYGLVIYTGRNTKIMKNSQSTSNKMSQIQRKVNHILGFILIAQAILSIICGFLAGFFNTNNSSTATYIPFDYGGAADGVISFFTYFVLINTMIPISLIVSIEIVKMTQSYFIDKDIFMYSDYRKKGANVRSASLNQELGQIEHIFSDKTGTLTTNRMEFKIAVIGSTMFGDLGLIIKDQDRPPQQEVGFHDDKLKKILQGSSRADPIREIIVRDRQKRSQIVFNNLKDIASQYLTALSVAHQVVVQTEQETHKKIFQGPSPDEITLVEAAKEMGFQFLNSTQKTTQILKQGKKTSFQLLQLFPFNSQRKRMSVIIRDGGIIKMYTKGADNVIKDRLAPDQTLILDDQLTKFSNIGLRTLLVGMRIISQQQYDIFTGKADRLPIDNREELFKDLVNQLQTNFYIIGATAVLDRLQDEVPQTIRDLIRANIKIWMLTGDKMETAQNIAKSCNLILPSYRILKCKFTGSSIQQVRHSLLQLRRQSEQSYLAKQSLTMMIQGIDFAKINKDDQCQDHFVAIAQKCQSVVCCRLQPLQKAQVVGIVRKKLDKITLAIGDGANDVPMIKAAHIGIGLFGQEGMGAVQASDYALPEFRMLWRLLLVHGRWNYIRIAEMILYFFYKNMLFTFPQFLFAFYCAYSGQTIFQDMYVSLFNLIFTSIPLIIRAVFEQDVYYMTKIKENNGQQDASAQNVARSILKQPPEVTKFIPKGYAANKYLYRLFPKLYYIGQQNCVFNYRNFIFWIIEGVLESLVIFFFAIYILDSASINNNGYSTDMWITSLTIYSSVISIVTFKLAAHTKFMSIMLFFSLLILSIGIYVAYMWISNYYFSYTIVDTASIWFTSGQTYFLVLFGTCLVLFVDGIVLTFDEDNSGLVKKLRNIINDQKFANASQYEMNSIKFSVATVLSRAQAQ